MGCSLLLAACSGFIHHRNYKINEIKATCHPVLSVLYLQPRRLKGHFNPLKMLWQQESVSSHTLKSQLLGLLNGSSSDPVRLCPQPSPLHPRLSHCGCCSCRADFNCSLYHHDRCPHRLPRSTHHAQPWHCWQKEMVVGFSPYISPFVFHNSFF